MRPSGLERLRGNLPTRPSTLLHARKRGPLASESSIEWALADASDPSREASVARALPRGAVRGRANWRALTVAGLTGASDTLPAGVRRSHLRSLDAARARQGAAARIRARAGRVSVGGAASRAEAQQGPGALAGRS